MADVVEILAQKLFKRQYPNRSWDLVATKRSLGVDAGGSHATEPEREYFRSLAHAEILRDATEANDDAQGS